MNRDINKLVTDLLELHTRMLRAIHDQKPYPVRQEIGKADSDLLLDVALFVEAHK